MNERRSRSTCGEHLAGKLILADIAWPDAAAA